MKYLPNSFPIRYAIVAHSQVTDVNKHHEEVLYRQLTSWLMKNPLTVPSLNPQYGFYNLRHYGVAASSIARLNPEKKWWDKAQTYFTELMPDMSGSNTGAKTAFALSLYSYHGAGEVPWFLKAQKAMGDVEKKRKVIGNPKLISNKVYTENLNMWQQTYTNLLEGRISEPDFWERKRTDADPIYLQIPYSYVWEALDNQRNGGVMPPPTWSDIHYMQEVNDYPSYLNAPRYLPPREVEEKSIQVVVCRSLRSLFYEEFFRIYKDTRYCNNCDQPLPADYKGVYCTRDECERERDKKRKRRTRSLRQRQAQAKVRS